MTFTYSGILATNLDKVRFHIGDTSATAGAGKKPDGTNYTDEELNGLISAEGDWGRAVAAALENLAALYSVQVDITLGPRRESLSQAANRYQALAEHWRKKYGQVSTGARVGSRSVIRVDGYSQDIASDEV